MSGLETHADYVYPFVVASPGCNPAMSMIRDVLLVLNDKFEILSEDNNTEHVRMIASNSADQFRTPCQVMTITWNREVPIAP